LRIHLLVSSVTLAGLAVACAVPQPEEKIATASSGVTGDSDARCLGDCVDSLCKVGVVKECPTSDGKTVMLNVAPCTLVTAECELNPYPNRSCRNCYAEGSAEMKACRSLNGGRDERAEPVPETRTPRAPETGLPTPRQ